MRAWGEEGSKYLGVLSHRPDCLLTCTLPSQGHLFLLQRKGTPSRGWEQRREREESVGTSLSMGRWMTEVEHRALASESGDLVRIPAVWLCDLRQA